MGDIKIDYKKLELKKEGTWFKRFLSNPHTKKTLIYIAGGIVLGIAFTFFTEGNSFIKAPVDEFFKNALTGAFLGFFITNSPCSRGAC